MPLLYIHVPFCLKKCDYCAFYSVPFNSRQVSLYIQGMKQEMILRQKEAPLGVSSLFMGGGTPTVLSACQLDDLLEEIHAHFTFSQVRDASNTQIEKTVEANPGTLDLEKLNVLRKHGINRISLGVQSFNPELMHQIGRIHSVEDILTSIRLIREVGFDNLNLDLIFGLPGQTPMDWQDTLKKAVAISPEHLSVYALSLEENTPLGRKYLDPLQSDHDEKNPQLPDDDLQADMYEWAVAYLNKNGYLRYEISNFAKANFSCQHNSAYWLSEPYIGLGPGAVSCIGEIRTRNRENITEYVELLASEEKPIDHTEIEVLTLTQRISEYMMLGLRTTQGVNIQAFSEKFEIEIQNIFGQIMANYIDSGVLWLEDGWLKIQPKYMFVANSIFQKFIL